MKKPEASFLTFTTLFKTGPNTKKKKTRRPRIKYVPYMM